MCRATRLYLALRSLQPPPHPQSPCGTRQPGVRWAPGARAAQAPRHGAGAGATRTRDATRRCVCVCGGGGWRRKGRGTFDCSPTARYSPDGGPCFSGRAISAPQLHRNRAPFIPLIAGKREAPARADGAQPSGKASAHSPPSMEMLRVPTLRSSATPSVLPAANQPLATLPVGEPLPLAGSVQEQQQQEQEQQQQGQQQQGQQQWELAVQRRGRGASRDGH
jgi:hypothetical protein